MNLDYLSRKGYNRLMNRSFAGMVSGQKNSTVITNSVTIDPADGRISCQGSLPIGKKEGDKKLSFLSFNLGGDLISDSYSILVKDSKLNSNVYLNAQYHIRFRKKVHIQYFYSDLVKLKLETQSINREKELRIMYLFTDAERAKKERFHDSISLELVSLDIREHQSKYDSTVSRLRSMRISPEMNTDQIEALNDSIYSLKKSLDTCHEDSIKLVLRLDSLHFVIENSFFMRQVLKRELEKNFDQQLRDLEYQTPIQGIRYGWFSFAAGASRKTYYRYYPELSFEDQVIKENLATWHIGITYNYFLESSYPNILLYWNAGIGIGKDNNTGILNTQKIDQTWEYTSTSGDTTRSVQNTYHVYTDPIEEYWLLNLFANLYLIHSTKSSAFHLFPSLKFYGDSNPYMDLGFGYAFSYKSKKEGKSVANTEFYFELHDLGNQGNAESRFYNRNTIGIRLTLPFYFLN